VSARACGLIGLSPGASRHRGAPILGPGASLGHSIFLVCTVIVLALHPARAVDTFSAAFGERIAATPKRGFLYRVVRAEPRAGGVAGGASQVPTEAPTEAPTEGAASLLYLYGTVHVGRAELFPINAAVATRLGQASRLALEADPANQASLARMVQATAFYPENDSLANHVPPELLARLPRMGQRYHLSMARMLHMRAWMLAQSFDVLELGRAGLSGGEGVEVILSEYARQRHVPVVEIEGFEQQLRLLSTEPPAVQQDELRESIDEIEDGQAARDAKALLDGWAQGDVAAIEASLAELRAEEGPFAHFMVEEILAARNQTMADRAEDYLREGGVTFFAVGALHLFSDQGLIAELARRGYRVEDEQ
jgi:uncharacterized protein YbaP (TraB family)